MTYGARPYGYSAFGDQPPHDPPLVGSNLKGNGAFGRYPFGGFKERGADQILFSGGIAAADAAIDAVSSIYVAGNGALSAAASIDGNITLPPALAFAAALAAAASEIDAAASVDVRALGALLALDAETTGAMLANVRTAGALNVASSEIDSLVGMLIATTGGLAAGAAPLSADVLVFPRRRSVHAIAS